MKPKPKLTKEFMNCCSVYDCAELLYKTLHRAVLINLPC